MANFTLELSEKERSVLLDLLRNQGPHTEAAEICRTLFLKLQTAASASEFVLPDIEEGAVCESCE